MLKNVLRAAALAAAVLASVPALAAEQRTPDVRVYYGDLDLSDPADVARLDGRLARAVNAVCPSANGVRELSRLRTIGLCRSAKRAEVAPLRERALAAAQGGKAMFAKAP